MNLCYLAKFGKNKFNLWHMLLGAIAGGAHTAMKNIKVRDEYDMPLWTLFSNEVSLSLAESESLSLSLCLSLFTASTVTTLDSLLEQTINPELMCASDTYASTLKNMLCVCNYICNYSTYFLKKRCIPR